MESHRYPNYEDEYGFDKEQAQFLMDVVDRIQVASNDFTLSGAIELSDKELAFYNCAFFGGVRADGEDINLDMLEAFEDTFYARFGFVNRNSAAPFLRERPTLAFRRLEDGFEVRCETSFSVDPLHDLMVAEKFPKPPQTK